MFYDDGVRLALSGLVLIAGCDQVYGLRGRGNGSDASVDEVDAPCTLGPFNGAEVFVHNGFPAGTYDPAMSSDGLEMFYVVQNVSLDLRYANRPSREAPWTDGLDIANLNDLAANDADPTITADGLSLLFTSTRAGGTPSRAVYEVVRDAGGTWSDPVRRMGIDVNAWSIDISADGTALFVMEGDLPASSLYRFKRTGIGKDFESRTEVGVGTRFPSVSADESELYFHDGEGVKRMINVSGAFVSPELVVPDEQDPDLSHDGMTLTFQIANGIGYVKRACATDQ